MPLTVLTDKLCSFLQSLSHGFSLVEHLPINFVLENNIIPNSVLEYTLPLCERHISKTHTETGKIIHYLSAVFWTGNRKITYSKQQQGTCYKFTMLAVNFQYYPIFIAGGFRRFNELKKNNPKFKALVGIAGWNEGSNRYSEVSHLQCVYIQITSSSWCTGKTKCNVLPVNNHKHIDEQIMLCTT
jgi:hypothetical protein